MTKNALRIKTNEKEKRRKNVFKRDEYLLG